MTNKKHSEQAQFLLNYIKDQGEFRSLSINWIQDSPMREKGFHFEVTSSGSGGRLSIEVGTRFLKEDDLFGYAKSVQDALKVAWDMKTGQTSATRVLRDIQERTLPEEIKRRIAERKENEKEEREARDWAKKKRLALIPYLQRRPLPMKFPQRMTILADRQSVWIR